MSTGTGSVRYHWCGQVVEMREAYNGYLLWPLFLVDGQFVRYCPSCGYKLRLDHRLRMRPPRLRIRTVETTGDLQTEGG